MIKINVFDNIFQHSKQECGKLTMTHSWPPNEMEWVPRQMKWDGVTVFTEDFIFDPIVDEVESRVKVALLFEPPAIHPWSYEKITEVEDKFDYILTYSQKLLDRDPKYLKYIVGQSRVEDSIANNAPFPKTKKVSMIASNKMMSDGHRYRHEIVQSLHPKHQFDLWGSAYRPFNHKVDPLKDYQFSIAVMNSKMDNYFTEILLDCFRLGTIPIFWGCPNIGDYFNTEGILTFDTIEELDEILSNLPDFNMFNNVIFSNWEKCKKYIHTDDYLAKILKEL